MVSQAAKNGYSAVFGVVDRDVHVVTARLNLEAEARRGSTGETGYLGAHQVGEELENLSRFGVTPSFGLAVKQVSVDGHIEYSLCARNEAQVGDDVLVVAQEIVHRAHGAS